MSKVSIDLEANVVSTVLNAKLSAPLSSNADQCQLLIDYLNALKSGNEGATLTITVDAVNASGTVEANAVQADDTVTIEGVVLTAKRSPVGEAQFSGAQAVAASLVVQDLTYTAATPGLAGNSITIEYVGGGTAGDEVVTVDGTSVTVEIEDGVSTATEIKAAWDAEAGALALATVAVTGTGGNAQEIEAETPLANGLDAISDNATATSIAAKINAHSTLSLIVSAAVDSSDLDKVIITSLQPGVLGNEISLASSNGGRLTLSGAALAGGDDGDSSVRNINV